MMKFNLSIRSLLAGLGLTALVLLMSVHGLLYYVARVSVDEANEQAARMSVENTVRNIANLVSLLGLSVAGQADDTRLAGVIAQADPAITLLEEERVTHNIPGAWLVRLLPENIDALDESRSPRMGFSDLNMVKNALAETPPPAVHLANSPNAHLAMARRLANGGGVIHASWPTKILDAVMVGEGGACGMELRQEGVSLLYRGAPGCKERAPDGEKAVSGTPWVVVYWSRSDTSSNSQWFASVAVGSTLLVGGLTFFLIHLLSAGLGKDRKKLLDLASDPHSVVFPGGQAFKLAEFAEMADELAKLKRIARDKAHLHPAEHEPVARILEAPPVPAEPPAPAPTPAPAPPPKPAAAARPAPRPALAAVPEHIFRAAEICGVVGDSIKPEVVYALGLAIGSEMAALGEHYVAIAYDGRLSGPNLSQSLAQGLLDSGRLVVNLGRVPTSLLYYATHVLDTQSAVMLTAGHAPAQYNGLKIVIGGEAVSEVGLQVLRQRIEQGDFVGGAGKMESYNLIPEYTERVVGDTQLGLNLKVVLDCANGVAAEVAPDLIRELGCEVVELFCEVDGHFPGHAPDPSQPDNLQALIAKVVETGADLGVAFDGSGERLGLVDSEGKIVQPDRLMMLFAADVLSREPGADVIYDVKSSRLLPSQIVKNGGRPLLWRSNHAAVKAKIKESGAMLAGGMDGLIYFLERWYGFEDAIYACARLIEILSNTGETSAETFAALPNSVNTPELVIPLTDIEPLEFMEQLAATASFPESRITDIDGLRVDFLDGWGAVTASDTLPALIVRFEADSVVSLERIQRLFAETLSLVNPDLELPF